MHASVLQLPPSGARPCPAQPRASLIAPRLRPVFVCHAADPGLAASPPEGSKEAGPANANGSASNRGVCEVAVYRSPHLDGTQSLKPCMYVACSLCKWKLTTAQPPGCRGGGAHTGFSQPSFCCSRPCAKRLLLGAPQQPRAGTDNLWESCKERHGLQRPPQVGQLARPASLAPTFLNIPRCLSHMHAGRGTSRSRTT